MSNSLQDSDRDVVQAWKTQYPLPVLHKQSYLTYMQRMNNS
jgi:hypothetical protein